MWINPLMNHSIWFWRLPSSFRSKGWSKSWWSKLRACRIEPQKCAWNSLKAAGGGDIGERPKGVSSARRDRPVQIPLFPQFERRRVGETTNTAPNLCQVQVLFQHLQSLAHSIPVTGGRVARDTFNAMQKLLFRLPTLRKVKTAGVGRRF